jgi:hypothetical protein
LTVVWLCRSCEEMDTRSDRGIAWRRPGCAMSCPMSSKEGREGRRVADRIRSAAMTALGIVLALIPPALWVAWTESVLMMVVAAGAVSAALLVVLAEFETQTAEDQQTRHGVGSREVLPDESIAEVHRSFR